MLAALDFLLVILLILRRGHCQRFYDLSNGRMEEQNTKPRGEDVDSGPTHLPHYRPSTIASKRGSFDQYVAAGAIREARASFPLALPKRGIVMLWPRIKLLGNEQKG